MDSSCGEPHATYGVVSCTCCVVQNLEEEEVVSLTRYWRRHGDRLSMRDPTLMENLQGHAVGRWAESAEQTRLGQELYAVSIIYTIKSIICMAEGDAVEEEAVDRRIGVCDASASWTAKVVQFSANLQPTLLDERDLWSSKDLLQDIESCLRDVAMHPRAADLFGVAMNLMAVLEAAAQVCINLSSLEHICDAATRGLFGDKVKKMPMCSCEDIDILHSILMGRFLAKLTRNPAMLSSPASIRRHCIEYLAWTGSILEALEGKTAGEKKTKYPGWRQQLALSAAAILEFVLSTNRTSKQALVDMLMSSGLFRCLIKELAVSDSDTVMYISRSLLLCCCFSGQLFQWAVRVPHLKEIHDTMRGKTPEEKIILDSWRYLAESSSPILRQAIVECVDAASESSPSSVNTLVAALQCLNLIDATMRIGGHVSSPLNSVHSDLQELKMAIGSAREKQSAWNRPEGDSSSRDSSPCSSPSSCGHPDNSQHATREQVEQSLFECHRLVKRLLDCSAPQPTSKSD